MIVTNISVNSFKELLSHRGITLASAMLLSALSLEVPVLSLPASVLYAILMMTRVQPSILLLAAALLPWLMKCMLLSSWTSVPNVDFMCLAIASVVYCYSFKWIVVLERMSMLGFILAVALYAYKDVWFSLIEKTALSQVTDTVLIGLLSVKVSLLVSMVLFFCARWAALFLKQSKKFERQFKKPKVSMNFALASSMLLLLTWVSVGTAGLGLPLLMPFWYVGHVSALSWMRKKVPRSWSKPLPTVFYYAMFFTALFTDVLMMILVSMYMGLGVYQSYKNHWEWRISR